MSKAPMKPRAFRLDDPNLVIAEGEAAAARPRGAIVVTPEAKDAFEETEAVVAAQTRRPRSRWGALLWSALGGLLSLSVGLWATRLVDELFSYATWLGWLAAVLAALAILACLAILIREVRALLRLARIEGLHERATAATAADDRDEARRLVLDLVALYRADARMARARAAVEAAAQEIVDGADLVRVAEREMMMALDLEARLIVADAAKRVSVVTAVSPRALVDLLFVAAETMRMLRRLAAVYGGRPGSLGLFKLFRHALGNLAVTGGMAAGDSLLSQVLGHGLASRISAKLGEGVLNGILIARLGLAAIDAIRPLPFAALPRPGVSDVAGGLFVREDKG
jgi:putative membrane protein